MVSKLLRAAALLFLTLFVVGDFAVSSPFFTWYDGLKEKIRSVASISGIGARHSYFANLAPYTMTYEMQLRDLDGQLLRRFEPPINFDPFFQFVDAHDELHAETVCPRLGARLNRKDDDQVFVFKRVLRLRSFEKFKPEMRGVVRLEVLTEC